MRQENLRKFDPCFSFEDETDPEYIEEVVARVLTDRYKGVNWQSLVIDQMGGTTHFVYFEAIGRRLPRSVFDLPPEEQQARIDALFHLDGIDY